MTRAIWSGTVITEREEGNQYLLPAAVEPEYPRRSEIHTACGWKGTAEG